MSEVQDRPTESTALVAVKASLPTILAIDGTRDILSALLDELSGYVPDGSTEEGRSEATSKAYKVSRAKNDIIRLADKQKEGAQAIIKGVNAEIKIVETRMDAERDRIKKVVEDYKAIEATRVAAHQSALQQILDWPTLPPDATATDIAARIDALDNSELLRREWAEFRDRAVAATKAAVEQLRRLHTAAVTREDEARELAALRAEAEERARQEAARLQAEREAEIARQAAEAAKLAAEAEAERKAQEIARAAQREREAAAERERLAAEALERAEQEATRLAAEKEAARVAGHQAALASIREADGYGLTETATRLGARLEWLRRLFESRSWEEFAQEAYETIHQEITRTRDLYETARKREAERIGVEQEARRQESIRREAAAADAAREAERRRVAREREAADAEARRREENIAHRRKINRDARDAIAKVMTPAGEEVSHEWLAHASAIVEALAKRQIPHCTISY